MKKVVFILTILFSTLLTVSCTKTVVDASSGSTTSNTTTWDEAGIKKATEDFSILMGEGKIGEAMDKYTHPMLFEKILEMSGQDMPLEDFKKMVLAEAASAFEEDGLKMTAKDFKIDDMTDIIKEEGIFYSLVNTSAVITMEYIVTEDDEESDIIELMKQTALIFKMQYGQDNVTIDEENKTLTINASSKTIAIGDKKYDDWRIMDYKREQLINFEILTESVAKKLDDLD